MYLMCFVIFDLLFPLMRYSVSTGDHTLKFSGNSLRKSCSHVRLFLLAYLNVVHVGLSGKMIMQGTIWVLVNLVNN